MILLCEVLDQVGFQIFNLSCICRAAHHVPKDILEVEFLLNDYVNLESFNFLYDSYML